LVNIIYEFTLEFCRRYLDGSNSKKKMVFLADSVKESSLKTSYQKLLWAYKNFIVVNDLEIWPAYSLRLRRVKGIAYRPYKCFEMYKPFLSSPEAAANAAICLINQIVSSSRKPKTSLTGEMYYY